LLSGASVACEQAKPSTPGCSPTSWYPFASASWFELCWSRAGCLRGSRRCCHRLLSSVSLTLFGWLRRAAWLRSLCLYRRNSSMPGTRSAASFFSRPCYSCGWFFDGQRDCSVTHRVLHRVWSEESRVLLRSLPLAFEISARGIEFYLPLSSLPACSPSRCSRSVWSCWAAALTCRFGPARSCC